MGILTRIECAFLTLMATVATTGLIVAVIHGTNFDRFISQIIQKIVGQIQKQGATFIAFKRQAGVGSEPL